MDTVLMSILFNKRVYERKYMRTLRVIEVIMMDHS